MRFVYEKGLINPVLIPVVALPHFILGALLASFNWRRLGFPEKARRTLTWSLIATAVIVILASFIPPDTLKKLWSVGVGINLGTGMALRTMQLPEYNRVTGRE